MSEEAPVPTCSCCGRALVSSALRIDATDSSVSYRGSRVFLTLQEFRALQAIIAAFPAAVSRETLNEALGGRTDGYAASRGTVDIRILKLRKQLKAIELVIGTQHGFGYALLLDEPEAAELLATRQLDTLKPPSSEPTWTDRQSIAELHARGVPKTEIARRLNLTLRALAAVLAESDRSVAPTAEAAA